MLLRLHVLFANPLDGGLQGDYTLVLVGDSSKYIYELWQSKHKKIKNTFATETLTMVDLVEVITLYREFIQVLSGLEDKAKNVFVICYTDNSSRHDAVYSSNQILDKRLHDWNISILRKTLDKNKIIKISWL